MGDFGEEPVPEGVVTRRQVLKGAGAIGVAAAAMAEIEKFYSLNIATPAEKTFFDNARSMYQNVTAAAPGIEREFRDHQESHC